MLAGYLIAYLNLDEVIRIIRFEDHPKEELMKRFELSEVQANAILDMRLRALHKLQEIEIKREHESLEAEQAELEALLADEARQWARIADELRATREAFGKSTDIGRRHSSFAEAPEIAVDLDAAMIEKEPITVILSEKGWIRALRGHQDDYSRLQFKAGDRLKFAIKAQTTDKIVLFASDGRFFTLAADKLPGGRGHGEPVRLMLDIADNHDIVQAFVHRPGRKLLVASTAGNGFIVSENELIAMTRKGKQVLNVAEPDEAAVCVPAEGDMVAVIGENRKLLVFPLAELNEMTRGRGTRLQRYKDGGLADAKIFTETEGLSWVDGAGRTFTVNDLTPWRGNRAQAGRLAPRGFPRSNRFGPAFG